MKRVLTVGCLALLTLVNCSRLSAQAAPPKVRTNSGLPASGTPTFKVDVDLALVEVGVHDEHGRAVSNLKQEDFRVFEDGAEQQIRAFSHEELPLAVALVIDNSSSIVAALEELRAGALDTLALLKPDDQVAIFSFGEKPGMVEGLTSDNEPSEEQSSDVPQVVRAAQQSGTPIYSIKVGYLQHSRTFFLAHSEPRLHDVEKICRQTGGEMIDTRNGTSVSSAMETILTWLKQGYTLGYSPSNKRPDGTYRTIEVRLNAHGEAHAHKYSIYARQGYYAPTGR